MSKTKKQRYPSDGFARIAIPQELHSILKEAALELGVAGAGTMVRQLLGGLKLKTAQDVKDLYLKQRA